jgi:hypothetical protein
MRRIHLLMIMAIGLVLFSCKKEYSPAPPKPPIPPTNLPAKKILLKDITIPHLPSPYYHFEYNADSTVSFADFASGFTRYDFIYSGNKIAEMRNNIFVNHDTLRYVYDNTGKVAIIIFKNEANVIYRHVFFAYNGDQVKNIEWDHREGNVGYLIDRTLTFTYHPDGNVKLITEHRPAINGSPEFTSTTLFDQYDDKINVDDFSLIHDGIHDHLFMFAGFRLQKNNPRKEVFTGGVAQVSYTVNYTYTYNNDSTPSNKSGELLYTAGSQAGQRFQTNTFYTYY